MENYRFAFLSPLLEGLGQRMMFTLGQWKAHSELPISVNWIFSLDVATEALRVKIDQTLAISLQHGHFYPKFQVEGVSLPIIFAQIVRPINALQLCRWQFHTKNLCSRLSSSKVRF